mgnify:CR=1 FL=1
MRGTILSNLRDCARSRRDLEFANLAQRQQFLVFERKQRSSDRRPRSNLLDRTYRLLRCQWWSEWRRPLRLVKPQKVVHTTPQLPSKATPRFPHLTVERVLTQAAGRMVDSRDRMASRHEGGVEYSTGAKVVKLGSP